MIRLFLTGWVSILGQVVLLRELNVAFYGVELIYLIAMGAWMLWTAGGSAVCRRTLEPQMSRLGMLFLAAALLLPCSAVLIRGLRPLLSGVPGAYLPFSSQIAGLAMALLPAGLVLGLLFQWAAKSAMSRGSTLARAYAVESLGGMVGGLAATVFLQLGVSNLRLALATSLICLAAAGPRLLAGIFSIPMALALVWAPGIDRATAAWTHTWNVLESRDTPYGRITVTERGGMVSVFENDSLSMETEGTEAEELVHLAAANVADLRRVLVAGGAADGTLHEVLRHTPDSVDCLELNPLLPELLLPFLGPEIRESYRTPGVRVLHGDPRTFLSGAGPKYDLILVGMGEPSSGQTNRFYTREFFDLCRRRLRRGGVVAFRLSSSDNYWSRLLTLRAGAIQRAMRSALADVIVLPGTTNTFIGSDTPLSRDPDVATARLAQRGVAGRLVSPQYVAYLYRNPRFPETARALESAGGQDNSDDRPVCYQYTLMLWLSRFLPEANAWAAADRLAPALRGIPAAVAAVVLAALFTLVRPLRRLRASLLVAVAGCAGMTLETVVLLHYQVTRGALYRDLGILMTGFMAGLSIGAFALDRWPSKTRGPGYSIVGVFACAAAAAAVFVRAPGLSGIAGSFGALLVTGSLVSAVFAWTSAQVPGEPRRAVGPLYAADLIGGCVAAVAASLVLIPAAGMSVASAMVVPLLLLSLILV